MAFIPYSSNTKTESPAITVDNQGRLVLNAALRRKLGCSDSEIKLFVFFEADTRRIGITKEYKQGNVSPVTPYKFDRQRGYSQARNFLDDHDIPYQDGAVKYLFDGMDNGVMTFKASREYDVSNISFKQEKNGNLVRER